MGRPAISAAAALPPVIDTDADLDSGCHMNPTVFAVWRLLLDMAERGEGGTTARALALRLEFPVARVDKALARMADLCVITRALGRTALRIHLVPTTDAAPGISSNGQAIKTLQPLKPDGPADGPRDLPLTMRACLKCSASFLSEGPHNRMCYHCRKSPSIGGFDDHAAALPTPGRQGAE